jgi:hypothetical protein
MLIMLSSRPTSRRISALLTRATRCGALLPLRCRARLRVGTAQIRQAVDERRGVDDTLAAVCLDVRQVLSEPIDQGQQCVRGFGVDHELLVAQPAQQVLARVTQLLEPGEVEKAAGALDGVNRPKDVGNDLGVARILLEQHQLLLHPLQVFAALDDELANHIVHCASLARRHAPLVVEA